MSRMRTRRHYLSYAYSLPLWNILELDSYVIQLTAKAWNRRSLRGACALSSKRGRHKIGIAPIDEMQSPNVRRKTPRVWGGGGAPPAEGEPPTGDDAAGATRGDKPQESLRGTRPPRKCLFSRAFKAETTGALQVAGVSARERRAERCGEMDGSSSWLDSVRAECESVVNDLLTFH